MKIFLTGATGYIGGSVAERLLREGHVITGLVRTESGARELEARGMRAVSGGLDDSGVIALASREADAVIDTAEANHAGVVYYAENGEETLKNVAASISRLLGFGGRTWKWSPQDAEAGLGPKAHSSFGSNSRVRGKRSRAELGWQPKGATILQEIEQGHYRRVHGSS